MAPAGGGNTFERPVSSLALALEVVGGGVHSPLGVCSLSGETVVWPEAPKGVGLSTGQSWALTPGVGLLEN